MKKSIVVSVVMLNIIFLLSCSTKPDLSDTIWLSANNPGYFLNEAINVDWREIKLTFAHDNNGKLFVKFDDDTKLGLRFKSDSLSIMIVGENKGMNLKLMSETLDKFTYSFDNGMFYIKLNDKPVFSSHYKFSKEKLTLILEKPNGTETLEFRRAPAASQ